jgi:hypothetical protein
MYLAGSAAVCAAATLPPALALPPDARGAAYAAAALAGFWLLASLAASWLVYDRSPLMTAAWVPAALGTAPRTWVAIDAGFDGFTPALRAALPRSQGRSLDIYNPALMTEPSIGRARRAAAAGSEQASHRHLPLADRSVEAVVLPLSAHELRSRHARAELFEEVQRVLVYEGRALVVEHLRNLPNFLAFGPGFLHFHSRRAWLRSFAQSNLEVCRELSITPFVRVFVLRRLP